MKELTIQISDESLEKIKLIKGGSFMLIHQPDIYFENFKFKYNAPQILEKNIQLFNFCGITTGDV